MKRKLLIITLGIFGFTNILKSQNFSDKSIVLKTINYNLNVKVDFQEDKMYSTCELSVLNPTDEKVQIIPLLLYRLLKVTSIKDEYGNSISYKQQVLAYEDWEVMQVNFVEIELEKPIVKDEIKKLFIKYSGHLLGYSETGMNYVKDKIDPIFTIIRPDCQAYPEIGYPSSIVNRKSGLQNFDYTIVATVPDSLMVVNGGKLINKTSKNGFTTYIYKNIKKAWRIDIAIGKYSALQYDKTKLFFFPQDSIGAKTVLKYVEKTFDLYSSWWGPLKDFQGFSVIEIPDGYGSQADVSSILQTASVFVDSTQMRQLYHEISHLWNVESNDEFSPRWNEGLATFLEYLVIEKLENREYLDYVTKWYLNTVKMELLKDTVFASTPLIDFGKKSITQYSYSMGMIMFRVLYGIVGETNFNEIVGSFYQKYYKTGASTEDFVQHSKTISNFNLNIFFQDWVYTTNYTRFVKDNMTIDEMVGLYSKN